MTIRRPHQRWAVEAEAVRRAGGGGGHVTMPFVPGQPHYYGTTTGFAPPGGVPLANPIAPPAFVPEPARPGEVMESFLPPVLQVELPPAATAVARPHRAPRAARGGGRTAYVEDSRDVALRAALPHHSMAQVVAAASGPISYIGDGTASRVVPFASTAALPELVLGLTPETEAHFAAAEVGDTPIDDYTLETLPIGHQPFEDLSGTAGVGKTTLVKKLLELSPPGSVVLAATTGIAAVNLGEGTTINALLGFFDNQDLTEKFRNARIQQMLRKHRASGVRRIIIDEKSMMHGQALTVITRAVDEVNQPRSASLESSGQVVDETAPDDIPPQIGITLVGDFGQLPPVPDEDPNPANRTPQGKPRKLPIQYLFESAEWGRYAANRTVLTKVWRQTDRSFITALHAVRRGDVAGALSFFTPDKFSDWTDEQFQGTTIYATNAEVDRHNQLMLDQLQTPELTATATRWGKPRTDWKNIPEILTVKVGALVMLLANNRVPRDSDDPRRGQMIYANGDLGTVTGVDEKTGVWQVRIMRTGRVEDVGPIGRANTIPLEPGRRKELVALGQGHRITEEKQEIIGTVAYTPLRVAYGCTVHKCLLAGTRVVVVGRGLVPVEEVRVDDVVITGEGHQARVLAAQPTGTKELVTVRFKSGRHLHMSPDHPLKSEAGYFIVGAAVGDRIRIGQFRDVLEWDTPLPALQLTPRGSRSVCAPRYVKPELAWWLGAVLGDGSVRDRRDGTIEFHARERELVERFADATQVLFGLSIRRYPKHVAVISKALRQWLVALGVDYVTSENKRVPECIFRSSHDSRAAFVQGLFDTDGCVDQRGYVRYVSTSRRLAEEVQVLLDSLGVRETTISSQIPTVVYRGKRRAGHRAYTVRIGSRGTLGFYETVRFSHAAKQAKLATAARRPVRKLPCNRTLGEVDTIVEIVRTGLEVPLHDLEVDHVDHSFIANGLVVSNTQGLTLDRVQVNIRDYFFKTPGMLFVALSRARTAEGLRIVGNQVGFAERCRVEGKVVPWL